MGNPPRHQQCSFVICKKNESTTVLQQFFDTTVLILHKLQAKLIFVPLCVFKLCQMCDAQRHFLTHMCVKALLFCDAFHKKTHFSAKTVKCVKLLNIGAFYCDLVTRSASVKPKTPSFTFFSAEARKFGTPERSAASAICNAFPPCNTIS